MEEMNTIEMQAQESAAGTAGYAESTAPAGPEAPQGDLGGADNEGTGARRQTPEENARFAAMRRRQEAQQREERLFHELVGDARNPETGMPFASKAEFVAWRDGAAGPRRPRQWSRRPSRGLRHSSVNSSEPRTRSSWRRPRS